MKPVEFRGFWPMNPYAWAANRRRPIRRLRMLWAHWKRRP